MINNHNRIKELKSQVKYKKKNNDFVIINDEWSIINVGAENYDDIFSPFCYKGGDTLSPSLTEYLQQKSNAVPLDYDLTIRFHVKNATQEKKKEIQSAVKENFLTHVKAIETRMHRTTIFSIWFLILGIISTCAYLFTVDKVPSAVSYIMDIFAWIFIWTAGDAFFLDRRVMILDKIKAYRIAAAKIEVVEFEQY